MRWSNQNFTSPWLPSTVGPIPHEGSTSDISHLSSAAALPCERGNPEDSALVLCACNTVQLLQHSRLPFSSAVPPKSPKLNALITRFRESCSSVRMSRKSKRLKKSSSDWLNSGNALIQRVKTAIFISRFATYLRWHSKSVF